MLHLRKSLTILVILALMPVFAMRTLYADQSLPFNPQLRKQIDEAFCENGQPSPAKIHRYRQKIKQRYHQVKQNLENHYAQGKGYSKKKSRKKSKKVTEIKAYRILLDYIDLLEKLKDPVLFGQTAKKILSLDYALRVNARKLASVELLEKIPFSLRPKKIPIWDAPRGEASNLENISTGEFYTQSQLKALKRKGNDISKLNPRSDSTFWVNHPIEEIDVRKHYVNGGDPLHKGIDVAFPIDKAYFDKIRKTQTKPKLDLYFFHGGKKLECKFKVGAEVYSETTCSALYTALGFSSDITKHAKNLKVVLGDIDHVEFNRMWESYYSSYDPDKYIKEKGEDEEGYYIVFYEGVLEAKPPDLLRVGQWAYGDVGNGGMREVRGTLLFNMWVSNLDLKEAENNKLVLRKIDGKYTFFNIQHDMGFSFGRTYMERPGAFTWGLVKKKTDRAVYMDFKCLVDNSLFRYVTYADARWMIRLIARLNREQITDAVALGGWPDPLQKLLVEKLISRRNQLVKTFGLEGETLPNGTTISLLKFDRHLTTPDGVVVDGKLKVYRFDERPQYFGPRINEILAMVLRGLRNGAVDTVVSFAASLRYITLEPEWFGLDRRIVSKVILRMDREIERNPDPVSEQDTFLVKDKLQIGLRMGYGSVISGDVAYWRKYTLVYPVPTRDAGRFQNKFILNLLLPFNYDEKYPNHNHALILEDYIQGRGKFRFYTLDRMLEFNFTGSQIILRRRFIGFKNDVEKDANRQVVFFDDRGHYDELRFRVFFKFLHLFHSRPFDAYVQSGVLKRNYIKMDIAGPKLDPAKKKALDQLMLGGNAGLMEKEGQRIVLHDRFVERKIGLKLLGLIQRQSTFRVDHVHTETASGSGNDVSKPGPVVRGRYLQVESRKKKSWRFFDNGESHRSVIRLTAMEDAQGNVDRPVMVFSLRVDDRSTHNDELRNGYLNFINTVAPQDDFVSFDPSLHTVNRLWGHTQTHVDIEFYEDAIHRLVKTDGETVWRVLAEVTGKSVDYWKRLSVLYHHPRTGWWNYEKDEYLAVKVRYFIRELHRARKSSRETRQMCHLVKSIRKCIYTSGQTYDPVLPAVVVRLVGGEGVFMRAVVKMPDNKEQLFPGGIPLRNEFGEQRDLGFPVFQFIFDDPSDIYHFF